MLEISNRVPNRESVLHQVALFALPLVLLLPFLLGTDILLLSRSDLGSDYTAKQLPNAMFIQRAWRETGSLPTWQPGVMSGVPVAGNPSFLVTYPPYWLILALPVPWTLNLLYALHLGLAGHGMYQFARRRLEFSSLGACSSAVCYMFAPKILAHVSGGHLDVVVAVAWLPHAILAIDRAISRTSWRWGLISGLVVGFIFVSHPPTAFLILLLLLAYATYMLIVTRPLSLTPNGISRTIWTTVILAGPGAAGFTLSASVQLLPMLELMPYLNRSSMTLADAASFALPPAILPLVLAIPAIPFPEWIVYTGAGIATLSWYGAFRAQVWGKPFWLVLGLLSLLFALGTATPMFRWFFQVLPGFDLLRVPSRTWFFISFVLAIFCGAGLDRLLKDSRGFTRVAAAVLMLLVISTILLALPANPWQWLAFVAAAISMGVILGLSRVVMRKDQRNRTGIIINLMLIFELSAVGWSFWQPGKVPEDPVWLREVEHCMAENPGRLYTEGRLSSYIAAREDGWVIEGIDPVQLRHYAAFIETATNCHSPAYSVSVPPFVANRAASDACPERQVDSRLLGLLSVSCALTSEPQKDPGWRLETRIGEDSLYRNEQAHPMAFPAYQTTSLAGEQTMLHLLEAAKSENRILVMGGKDFAGVEDPSGSADVDWLSASSFEVRVTTEQPAFLVLGIPYLPGWKAYDAGDRELSVYQAQLGIMGSYIDAGSTKLLFTYSPDSLELGKRLFWSAASLSALVFAISLISRYALQKQRKRCASNEDSLDAHTRAG